MAESVRSLNDLAREMNAAFVKVGKPGWRREFNTRLWACNRESALRVIDEYRDKLGDLVIALGWEDGEEQLLTSQRT